MSALKMQETMAPQRLKMSYEEYLDFAGDAQIVEWVGGEVIVYMPPILEHQRITFFLATLLEAFVQFFDLGTVVVAPFEVKLWPEGPSREPDVIFIDRRNLENLKEKRFEGAPDLIIEVISSGSVTEDRVRKFAEYKQAGVREYWLIDPRPRKRQVDCYLLAKDDEFHDVGVAEDGRYQATIIPHFWFLEDWLWQEELPNPQLALSEILLTVPNLTNEARQVYQALNDLLSNRS